MRPRLVDRYCGPGGMAMGYHRAGWEVVGVDIKPQPSYPFEFHQGDALDEDFIASLGPFDADHASPPCHDHMRTPTHNQAVEGTGWMLAETRKHLMRTGRPWVIENVPGAPLRPDIILCGCMFPDELRTRSERWFETSWRAFELRPACDHSREVLNRFRTQHGPYFRRHGHVPTRREVALSMGIDWMTGSEHQQAIPPPYGEYIGHLLMAQTMAVVSQ